MGEPEITPTAPTRQARPRRKGAPRGGRHGLSRTAAPVDSGSGNEVAAVAIAASPRPGRSRRAAVERPTMPTLSREAEMAYVRADMRKLFVIAGALLAFMFVILALVGR